MNMENESTSFSLFQLHLERARRLIPPIMEDAVQPEVPSAPTIISRMQEDLEEARDNLLLAQTHQAELTEIREKKWCIRLETR